MKAVQNAIVQILNFVVSIDVNHATPLALNVQGLLIIVHLVALIDVIIKLKGHAKHVIQLKIVQLQVVSRRLSAPINHSVFIKQVIHAKNVHQIIIVKMGLAVNHVIIPV